mgnify:CR=1 FL=1
MKSEKVLPFDSLELSSEDILMLEDMMYIIGGGAGCGCKDDQAPPAE